MVATRLSILASCVLLSLTTQAMGALIDLQLIIGDKNTCSDTHSKVAIDPNSPLDGNFNQGAYASGFDNPFLPKLLAPAIWLCIQDGAYDPTTAITNLTIVRNAHQKINSGCGPHLDSQGWKRIGYGEGSTGDFNQFINGGYIYMCYQKIAGLPPIEALEITTKTDCRLGTRVHAANGNIGDDDLCHGDHEYYIYLCAARGCTASNVQGSWQPKVMIAAPTDESWMHGTSMKNSSSSTSDWSASVTAEVSANLEVAGAKVSTKISTGVSQTYQGEWTETEQHEFTVHFTSEDVGKQAWQFVFTTHDNCNGNTDSLTKEFAVTEGRWRAPCCLPGYAVDAPAYTVCHSRDALISASPNCSVADISPLAV